MDVRVPTMPCRAPLVLYVDCSSHMAPFGALHPGTCRAEILISRQLNLAVTEHVLIKQFLDALQCPVNAQSDGKT